MGRRFFGFFFPLVDSSRLYNSQSKKESLDALFSGDTLGDSLFGPDFVASDEDEEKKEEKIDEDSFEGIFFFLFPRISSLACVRFFFFFDAKLITCRITEVEEGRFSRDTLKERKTEADDATKAYTAHNQKGFGCKNGKNFTVFAFSLIIHCHHNLFDTNR